MNMFFRPITRKEEEIYHYLNFWRALILLCGFLQWDWKFIWDILTRTADLIVYLLCLSSARSQIMSKYQFASVSIVPRHPDVSKPSIKTVEHQIYKQMFYLGTPSLEKIHSSINKAIYKQRSMAFDEFTKHRHDQYSSSEQWCKRPKVYRAYVSEFQWFCFCQ